MRTLLLPLTLAVGLLSASCLSESGLGDVDSTITFPDPDIRQTILNLGTVTIDGVVYMKVQFDQFGRHPSLVPASALVTKYLPIGRVTACSTMARTTQVVLAGGRSVMQLSLAVAGSKAVIIVGTAVVITFAIDAAMNGGPITDDVTLDMICSPEFWQMTLEETFATTPENAVDATAAQHDAAVQAWLNAQELSCNVCEAEEHCLSFCAAEGKHYEQVNSKGYYGGGTRQFMHHAEDCEAGDCLGGALPLIGASSGGEWSSWAGSPLHGNCPAEIVQYEDGSLAVEGGLEFAGWGYMGITCNHVGGDEVHWNIYSAPSDLRTVVTHGCEGFDELDFLGGSVIEGREVLEYGTCFYIGSDGSPRTYRGPGSYFFELGAPLFRLKPGPEPLAPTRVTRLADLDFDGDVGFGDLILFSNLFGSTNPLADFDTNGVVDFADWLTFHQSWSSAQ